MSNFYKGFDAEREAKNLFLTYTPSAYVSIYAINHVRDMLEGAVLIGDKFTLETDQENKRAVLSLGIVKLTASWVTESGSYAKYRSSVVIKTEHPVSGSYEQRFLLMSSDN